MSYSENQKKLLKLIEEHKCDSLASMILAITPDSNRTTVNHQTFQQIQASNTKYHICILENTATEKAQYHLIECTPDILLLILDCIALVQDAKSKRLITTYCDGANKIVIEPLPTFRVSTQDIDYEDVFHRVLSIINIIALPSHDLAHVKFKGDIILKMTDERYHPLPALTTFIKRSYLEETEYHNQEQQQSMILQYRLQRTTLLITIIIAVFGSLTSALVPIYCTPKSQNNTRIIVADDSTKINKTSMVNSDTILITLPGNTSDNDE